MPVSLDEVKVENGEAAAVGRFGCLLSSRSAPRMPPLVRMPLSRDVFSSCSA